jgi:hypothetical protein
MESTRLQLKQDIDIRWKITIFAKEAYKFSNYFVNPDTDCERNYILSNLHLNFIRLALWRLTVIELCKLFSDSDSQKYNLKKLLRKIANNDKYKELNFDNDTLKQYHKNLNEFDDSIDEIKRLRDKFYAHTDVDPFEKIASTLSLADCERLIVFAEELLQYLAGITCNEHYVFNTLYYDSRQFNFIKILSGLEPLEP